MARHSSSYLFQLVKSLSKQERNELQQFIGSSESASAQLYAAMKKCVDTAKPFEEKKQHIKNLPVVKNNLQNTVEKYLMCMAEPQGFFRNAWRTFELIRQLIDRGFYVQALQKLEKLKTEAEAREEFALLAYLLITENTYYDRLYPHAEAHNRFTENWELCTQATRKNLHMIEASNLNAKIVSIDIALGNSLSGEQYEILADVKNRLQQLITDSKNMSSYKLQSTVLATLMFVAELEGDEEAAKKISCDDIMLLNRYPHWRKFNPTGYAATILNHLTRFQQTPLHPQFSETLLNFDNSVLSAEMQSIFRPKFLPYWHLYYLYQQNNNKLQEVVAEQEVYRNVKTDSFTMLFIIQNNLQAAVFHILNDDTVKALDSLEWIIDKGITVHYPEFFLKAYAWKILLLAQTRYKTLGSIIQRFQYHINEYLPENKFFKEFCFIAIKHLSQELKPALAAEKLEIEFPELVSKLVSEPELDIITWLRNNANNRKVKDMMQMKISLSQGLST